MNKLLLACGLATTAIMLGGCDLTNTNKPIETSTIQKGTAGQILAVKTTGDSKILAAVSIDDVQITQKTPAEKIGSFFGRQAVVDADTETKPAEPNYILKLPKGAKNINYLSATKIIYLDAGTEDGYDHAKKLVAYDLDQDRPKTIYEPSDGFSIDEYKISPDKKLAALWEVKINPTTKKILGGESRITELNLADSTHKIIVGPQKTEALDNGNELLDKQYELDKKVTVQYPLFYDNQDRLWLDSWLPNSSGVWGAGVKTVEKDGSINDVATLKAGSYSADPISSKDGRFITVVKPETAQQENKLGISFAQEKPRKITIIEAATGTEKEIALPPDTYLQKQIAISSDGKKLFYTALDANDAKMLYVFDTDTGKTDSTKINSDDTLAGLTKDEKNIILGSGASSEGVSNSGSKYQSAYTSFAVIPVADLTKRSSVSSSDFTEIVDTLDSDFDFKGSSLLAKQIEENPYSIIVSSVNLPDAQLAEQRTEQQNTLPEPVEVTPPKPAPANAPAESAPANPTPARDQFTKDCDNLIPGYANAQNPQEVSRLFEASDVFAGISPQCKSVWQYFNSIDAGDIYQKQNQSAELTRYWHWFYWCFWDESMKSYPYLQQRGVKYNPNSLFTQYPLLRKCLNMGRGNCEDEYITRITSMSVRGSAADHMKCYDSPLYLYPKETTQVQIQAANTLFDTQPNYINPVGWLVKAEPSGKLTSLEGQRFDKISYDYSKPARELKTGYVVSQIALKSTLEKYAGKLGLNKKESADFTAFWMGKLQGTAPYIQISHYLTEESKQINPLEITPQPDTYIPVVMYFKKLQLPIATTPPIFESIKERKGFTAVEWSGIIE